MPATLTSRLDGIAAELHAKVSAAVKVGAEGVAQTATRNLEAGGHVLSGDLENAVHVERVGPAEYSVLAGDGDVFWGHLVEHGTTHSPPYPFLLPALEENEDSIVKGVGAVLTHL